MLLDDFFLHRTREGILHGVGGVRGIHEEGCAILRVLQHVHGFQVRSVVACHEVGFVFANQVRGVDDALTEAELRGGHGAGLLES